MAGMSDNPLVGDYTKGISKGVSYFHALDARIKREKANVLHVVSDLEMGLIRDQKLRIEQSISLSGLGRFGPKSVSKQAVFVARKSHKVVKINTPKNGLEAMLLLLQKHFCG